MADFNGDRKTGISFRWEIGPAFLAIVAQTIGALVAATMIYASLVNTATNTKDAAARLEIIVDRMKETQKNISERLVRVETTLDELSRAVTRFDQKLDGFKK